MRVSVLLLVALSAACAKRTAGPPQSFSAPIPVPQPATERTKLSPELQTLWERIEHAVGVRPPQPPEDADKDTIHEWAEGPFKDWLTRRRVATDYALQATFAMRTHPEYERGVGTALFAYMYEDIVGSIRGAPVPDHIAEDEGLLNIYLNALTELLEPYARLSAQAYYACVAIFAHHGDVSWWEWVTFCDQRGGEVVETYNLVPPEPEEDAEGVPF